MKLGFLMESEVYSFSRVMGFMLVIYWMIFAGRVTLATNVMQDLPFGIITIVLLAYGIGKTGEVIVSNNASKTTISNAEHKE